MSGSQGERRVLIPAGGTIPVRVPGDFIFIKFADRPVIVRIHGQSIVMRAGDRRKIERSAGNPMAPAFDIFDLENPSEDADLAVEFVAGEGDYSSQIINGEVIVAPGIRRADGRWYDDTRRDLSLRLALSSIEAVEHVKYGILHQFTYAGYEHSHIGRIRNLIGDDVPGRVFCESQGGYQSYLDIYRDVNAPGNRVNLSPTGWYGKQSAVRFCNGRYWSFWAAANPDQSAGGRVILLRGLHALTAEANEPGVKVERILDFRHWGGSQFGSSYEGYGVIISWGEFLYIVARASDEHWYLIKVTTGGEILSRVRMDSAISQLGVDNGVIHCGEHQGGEWLAAYRAEDLSPAEITLPSGADLGNTSYRCVERIGARKYFAPGHVHVYSSNARVITDRSWTDSASGRVDSCNGAGMFSAAAVPTDAALTLVRDASGRPAASGELIKAALDIYLGEAGGYVATDYLDHIYGVQFEYANYRRPLSIQTGGSSFLRSGIADNFQNVPLPQRIIITADADLASEVEQWNS